MKNRTLCLSSILGAALVAGCQPSNEKLAERYEGVVGKYCLECHDSAGREAGLSLEDVDLNNVAAHPELFETVARKLRGRQMPPPGGPRPDAETYEAFAGYLERRLDAAVARADAMLAQMQKDWGPSSRDADDSAFRQARRTIEDVRAAASALERFSAAGEQTISGVDRAARAELVATLQALQQASEHLARITQRFDQAPVEYLRGGQSLPVYQPEGDAR